jgi:hypothetical protein
MPILAGVSAHTLAKMNSFLRGELSAVETYRQALDVVGKLPDADIRQELMACQQSHQMRADLLTEWIMRHGGQPAHGSGAWGALARLLESGAKAFGEKSALALLEEGENRGMEEYRHAEAKLDPEARDFLLARILHEQEKTHVTVCSLKRLIP